MAPLFRAAFPDERLIVVSNREPYEHRWSDEDTVEVRRPAGGLTSALDPVLQAVGGVWIAWGSGDADAEVVDPGDRIRVPPEEPAYTLRRLWLDQRDIHDYYLGFSNEFLWPLCHYRPVLARIRSRHWERYEAVNRRFAEAVLREAEGVSAAVWFQDYHLALAPGYVRASRPDLALAHFWHIPWPPLEIFSISPQAGALLEGLLATDLLGFHLPSYGDHFLHCAEEILGAEVDWLERTATWKGHVCSVRAFPISIDVEAREALARSPRAASQARRLHERFAPGGAQLGVGVDRMDYSKGLEEKFKALEVLWERHPELRGAFSFVQVAVPSRTDIEAYESLEEKLERMVWRVNDRFGGGDWRPVHLIKEALSEERLAALYRAADFCVVSSLQDGMNLVAKEYVASQVDEHPGVLLLSRFTGASTELDGAIRLNPYDIEGVAERLREALEMPAEERLERLERMRSSLRSIYDWLADIFAAWGAVAHGRPAPLSPAEQEDRPTRQAPARTSEAMRQAGWRRRRSLPAPRHLP